MSKPCEYCGHDLPFGVNKKTRQTRSRHFDLCEVRLSKKLQESALEAKDEPVVWNEGVPAMLPKQKEGETFIVSYEPKLEAKDEPVQEPWESEMRNELVALGFDGQCPESIGITLKRWRDGYAAAQRKPLTDEEIQDALEVEFLGSDLKRNWQDDLRVAQAIEAAHGIIDPTDLKGKHDA